MIQFPRSAPAASDSTTATDDRRRSPRIELLGRLHGHSVSLDLPVRVVQISLGGMAIETAVPFPAGAMHIFRLTLGDGSSTELTGKVMHSRNTAPAGSTPVFTTGVQFVEGDTDGATGVVDDILHRVR